MLYVPDQAYALQYANDGESEIRDAVAEHFSEVMHYDALKQVMNREPKGGAQLQAMYPKLVAEITLLRDQ